MTTANGTIAQLKARAASFLPGMTKSEVNNKVREFGALTRKSTWIAFLNTVDTAPALPTNEETAMKQLADKPAEVKPVDLTAFSVTLEEIFKAPYQKILKVTSQACQATGLPFPKSRKRTDLFTFLNQFIVKVDPQLVKVDQALLAEAELPQLTGQSCELACPLACELACTITPIPPVDPQNAIAKIRHTIEAVFSNAIVAVTTGIATVREQIRRERQPRANRRQATFLTSMRNFGLVQGGYAAC